MISIKRIRELQCDNCNNIQSPGIHTYWNCSCGFIAINYVYHHIQLLFRYENYDFWLMHDFLNDKTWIPYLHEHLFKNNKNTGYVEFDLDMEKVLILNNVELSSYLNKMISIKLILT